ncbi:MAG: hypothetical protein AB7O98_16300 [Hyphomonadaceae bacterium]
MKRFAEEFGAGEVEISQTFEWAPFFKLIAKVGHSYAVGILGLQGIDFFLPKLIVGDHAYISRFVGSCSDPNYQHPPHSDVALTFLQVGDDVLAVVRLTFFGNGRFPIYEAIVGKVLDQTLIATKFANAT